MAGKSDLPLGMASLKACLDTAATGFRSSTGMDVVDNLLNKGGMASMLNTIWLILSAMFFAGVMDGSGMMGSIADGILSGIRGAGNLVAATLGTAVLVNILAAEQYLSIVITGRMYKEAYDKQGLHRKNLSRALEDAGTLTSPLVPWNTCGAFMATTLGVATYLYLPFAFLNIITPLVSLVYAYTGFTIEYVNKTEN
jgi:NhaC family Na+:H+ antiporter